MKIKFVTLCFVCASLSVLTARAQTAAPSSPPPLRPRVVAAQTATPVQPQRNVAPTPAPTATPAIVPVPSLRTGTATEATPAAAGGIAPAPAGTTTPLSVVTPATAPPLVLQPISPLPVNKVRARLDEAQRELKTHVVPTSLGSSLRWVTLAALDPETSRIHTLTLPKETILNKNTDVTLASSLGTLLRLRVVRPNYVNTAVVVSDLTGRQLYPLVLEYPIEKRGIFKEMAYYTSAHPSLVTPELVRTGQSYVRTMIDLAAKRLKDKGVTISPQLLDIAERLCLVEHVDHQRFRMENRRAIYDEVFALYGLNELDTYKYSVSTAGAGGMVQMIPWTYQMIRQRHPAIGLNPDFVFGMRNHGNALEAMLLYMRMTWAEMSLDPDVISAMSAGWATQVDLMAAGYNSNPARLPGYIRRGGAAWRTLIPRETQMYLQIYKSVESLVPLKARDKQDGE